MSLNTKEIPGTPLPKDEAHVTQAYETPSHRIVEGERWSSGRARSPQRPLGHFLHNLTCLLVFGSSDLHHLWEETSHGYSYNIEAWESTRDSIVKKLKHINIVVRFRRSSGDKSFADFDCDVCSGWSVSYCDIGVYHHRTPG